MWVANERDAEDRVAENRVTENRVAVIMQPHYLPWLGYFNLIEQSDVFVFLDDVQFSRQSWQHRNRVLVNGKPQWLTVPVERAGLPQRIREAAVVDTAPWRRKHAFLVRQSYARHPAGDLLEPLVEILEDTSLTRLADLNIRIIRHLCAGLGLSPALYRSSELAATGSRSEVLVEICLELDCDVYLSPAGSAGYLAEDGVFDHSPVRLVFQAFEPREYPQQGSTSFISHLSILDVLANLGYDGAREHIRESPEAASPGVTSVS